MIENQAGLTEEDLVLEWKEPAKNEEEESKRQSIESYVKWIFSKPEFKSKLGLEIDKGLKKALDEGRI